MDAVSSIRIDRNRYSPGVNCSMLVQRKNGADAGCRADLLDISRTGMAFRTYGTHPFREEMKCSLRCGGRRKHQVEILLANVVRKRTEESSSIISVKFDSSTSDYIGVNIPDMERGGMIRKKTDSGEFSDRAYILMQEICEVNDSFTRSTLREWLFMNRITDENDRLRLLEFIRFSFSRSRFFSRERLGELLYRTIGKIGRSGDFRKSDIDVTSIHLSLSDFQKILVPVQDHLSKNTATRKRRSFRRTVRCIPLSAVISNEGGIVVPGRRNKILCVVDCMRDDPGRTGRFLDWISGNIDRDFLTRYDACVLVTLVSDCGKSTGTLEYLRDVGGTMFFTYISSRIEESPVSKKEQARFSGWIDDLAGSKFGIFHHYWKQIAETHLHFHFGSPMSSNPLIWGDFGGWYPLWGSEEHHQMNRPDPRAPEFAGNAVTLKLVYDSVKAKGVTFLGGTSGTGKTYVATYMMNIFRMEGYAVWHELDDLTTVEGILEHIDSFLSGFGFIQTGKDRECPAGFCGRRLEEIWSAGNCDLEILAEIACRRLCSLDKKVLLIYDNFESVYSIPGVKTAGDSTDCFPHGKMLAARVLMALFRRIMEECGSASVLCVCRTVSVTLEDQFRDLADSIGIDAGERKSRIIYCPQERDMLTFGKDIASYVSQSGPGGPGYFAAHRVVFERLSNHFHYHSRLICFIIDCLSRSGQEELIRKILRPDTPAAYADTRNFHLIINDVLFELNEEWMERGLVLKVASVFDGPWQVADVEFIFSCLEKSHLKTTSVKKVVGYLLDHGCPMLIRLDSRPLNSMTRMEMPGIVRRHFREMFETAFDEAVRRKVYRFGSMRLENGLLNQPATESHKRAIRLRQVEMYCKGNDLSAAVWVYRRFRHLNAERNAERNVFMGDLIFTAYLSRSHADTVLPDRGLFVMYVRALLLLMHFDKAIRVCEYVIDEKEGNDTAELKLLYARALESKGDCLEALRVLASLEHDICSSESPETGLRNVVFFELAGMHFTLGHPDTALEYLCRVSPKSEADRLRLSRLLVTYNMYIGNLYAAERMIDRELMKLKEMPAKPVHKKILFRKLQIAVARIREVEHDFETGILNGIVSSDDISGLFLSAFDCAKRLLREGNGPGSGNAHWWSAVLLTIAYLYLVAHRNRSGIPSMAEVASNANGIDLVERAEIYATEAGRCVDRASGNMPVSGKTGRSLVELMIKVERMFDRNTATFTTESMENMEREFTGIIDGLIERKRESGTLLSDPDYEIEALPFGQWCCIHVIYECILTLHRMDSSNMRQGAYGEESGTIHDCFLLHIGALYRAAIRLNRTIKGTHCIRPLNLLMLRSLKDDRSSYGERLEAVCRLAGEEGNLAALHEDGDHSRIIESGLFLGMISSTLDMIECSQKSVLGEKSTDTENSGEKVDSFLDKIPIEVFSSLKRETEERPGYGYMELCPLKTGPCGCGFRDAGCLDRERKACFFGEGISGKLIKAKNETYFWLRQKDTGKPGPHDREASIQLKRIEASLMNYLNRP